MYGKISTGRNITYTSHLQYYGPPTTVKSDRHTFVYSPEEYQKLHKIKNITEENPHTVDFSDFGNEIVYVLYAKKFTRTYTTNTLFRIYILKAPTKIYYEVDINGEVRVLLKDLAPGPPIQLGFTTTKKVKVTNYELVVPTVSCDGNRVAVGQLNVLKHSRGHDGFEVYVYIIPYDPTDYGAPIKVLDMCKFWNIQTIETQLLDEGIQVTVKGISFRSQSPKFLVMSATTVFGTMSVCGTTNAQWYETGFTIGLFGKQRTTDYFTINLPLYMAGEKILICGTLNGNADVSDYTMPIGIATLESEDIHAMPSLINVDALGRASVVLKRRMHPLSEIRLVEAHDNLVFSSIVDKYKPSGGIAPLKARNLKDDLAYMERLSNVSLNPHAILRRVENYDALPLKSAHQLAYPPAEAYKLGGEYYWSSNPQFFPKLILGVDKTYKVMVCDRWNHPHCLAESDFDQDVGYVIPNPFIHSLFNAEWNRTTVILKVATSPFYPMVPHVILVKINVDTIIDYDRVCNSVSFLSATFQETKRISGARVFEDMYRGQVNYYFSHQYGVEGVNKGYVYAVCYSFDGRTRTNYEEQATWNRLTTATSHPKGARFTFLTTLNPNMIAKEQRLTFRLSEHEDGFVFATTGVLQSIQLAGIFLSEDLSYDCSGLHSRLVKPFSSTLSIRSASATTSPLFWLPLPTTYAATNRVAALPPGTWLSMEGKAWKYYKSRLFYHGTFKATKVLYRMCVCYVDGCTDAGNVAYSKEKSIEMTRFIELSLLSSISIGHHVCVYGKRDMRCFMNTGNLKSTIMSPVPVTNSPGIINSIIFRNPGRNMLVIKDGVVVIYNEKLTENKIVTIPPTVNRIYSFTKVAFISSSDGFMYFVNSSDLLDLESYADETTYRFKDPVVRLNPTSSSVVRLEGAKGHISNMEVLQSESDSKFYIFYVDESFTLHFTTAQLLDDARTVSMSTKLLSSLPLGDKLVISKNSTLIVKAASNVVGGDSRSFVFVYLRGFPKIAIFGVNESNLEFYGHTTTSAKLVDFAFAQKRFLGLAADISPSGEISQYLIEIGVENMTIVSMYYRNLTPVLRLGKEYSFEPLPSAMKILSYSSKQLQTLEAHGLKLDTQTGRIYGTPNKLGVLTFSIRGEGHFCISHMTIKFVVTCKLGSTYDETANQCIQCASGTFGAEIKGVVTCLKCTDYIKNSTTMEAGETSIEGCLCAPGSYLHGNECIACPKGTTSEGYGSKSCPVIVETREDGKIGSKMASMRVSCKKGTFLKGDACVACTLGYYCLGGTLQPIRCSVGMTTEKVGASQTTECVCNAGYEWIDGRCVACGRTSYKEDIGNTRCTPCPSSDIPRGTIYTPSYGATSSRQCMHCNEGFFYDAKKLSCVPCPVDSFCPGKGTIPVLCPSNSITRGTSATGRIDCLCVKGYGFNTATRFLLGLENTCTQCPMHTFQHVNGTNTRCIQCPKNTYTASTGATSLGECLPGPGYYVAGGEDVRHIASQMEALDGADLGSAAIKCRSNVTMNATTYVTVLSRSLTTCIESCKANVYCRFVHYGTADKQALHTEALLSGDANYNTYHPCKLIMAYEWLREPPSVTSSLQPLDSKKHENNVLCEIGRPYLPLSYSVFTVSRCPMNYYCPGGEKFTKFPCPTNSVTLTAGATHNEHCMCMPGFELSNIASVSVCIPCKEGFYKDSTSNTRCLACPDNMTTFGRGSVSASQCVCPLGFFAYPKSDTTDLGPSMLELQNSLPRFSQPSLLTEFIANNFNYFGVSDGSATLSNITCDACPDGYVCPGKWLPNSIFSVHHPPISCPEGSSVPGLSHNAGSVTKCMCKPGYGSGKAFGDGIFLSCQKCAPGTFSEIYSTSTCAGRCNDYAITFPGATSSKDCFCLPGHFMTLQNIDGEEKLACQKCSVGTVCPGGFRTRESRLLGSYDDKTAIFKHAPQHPRMGYMAIFKQLRTHSGGEVTWMPHMHETYITDSPTPPQFGLYEHVPDIHACIYANRCNVLGHGACDQGSHGYLCGKCKTGYDTRYFESLCFKCSSLFIETLQLLFPRLILLLLVLITCHINHRASTEGDFSVIVIFKIWYTFTLSTVPFGMMQITTSSSLGRFYNLYHTYFYKPVVLFMTVERLGCWQRQIRAILSMLESFGIRIFDLDPHKDLDYIHLWYLQRVVALAKPLLDVLLLCVMYIPCRLLYKYVKHLTSRGSRKHVIATRMMSLSSTIRDGASESQDEGDGGKLISLESLDTGKGSDAIGTVYIKSRKDGLTFLTQQILLLLTLHLPGAIINSLSLLWCGSVRYKSSDPINVLMHLPDQVCDARDPLFNFGRLLGLLNLGVWLGMLGLLFYSLSTSRYSPRSWNTLFKAGCDVNCRWWDVVHLSRQVLIACLIVCHYSIDPKGDTEYMRATCNLILNFIYMTLHLCFSPYDERNDGCFYYLESKVFFSNVCMSIFIQGSYLYDFSDLGGFPIVISLLTHIKILWTLLVEYGNIKFANLKRNGKNEFVNVIIDFMPFVYEHREANVYYDYKNDNIVLESSRIRGRFRTVYYNVISRPMMTVARFFGMTPKSIEDPNSCSYSLQNRDFFISCIHATIEKCNTFKDKVALPNTWFYFITRYVFWYCHCLHIDIHEKNLSDNDLFHKIVFSHFFLHDSVPERSLTNFLIRFPLRRLSSHGSVHHNGKACDGKCAIMLAAKKRRKVDEVAESLLVECLFDKMYDLGPVTLIEFYYGLLSLNQLHNSAVSRIFEGFRIHSLFLKDEKEFHLLREADLLNETIGSLKKDIEEKGQSGEVALQRHQMVSQLEEVESGIAKLNESIDHEHQIIMAGRAAAAVALNLHLGVNNIVNEELTHEDILAAISSASGGDGASGLQDRRKGLRIMLWQAVFGVLLFFSLPVSAVKPTFTVCLPFDYDTCDLTPLMPREISQRYFVIEERDANAKSYCVGTQVDIVGRQYTPTKAVHEAYLCSTNGKETTLIGTIFFHGIIRDTVKTSITYGQTWKVEAEIFSAPMYLQNAYTRYESIAFKRVNCDNPDGMLAISKQIFSRNTKIKRHATYELPWTPDMQTNDVVLCVCPLKGTCGTIADYTLFLGRRFVEGPHLLSPLSIECSYGAKCLMEINGRFHTTQKVFGVSMLNKSESQFLLQSTGHYYEYVIKEDDVAFNESVVKDILWIPSSSSKGVNIGTLMIRNYYMGSLFVVPFGIQELRIDVGKLAVYQPKFHILERSIAKADSSKPKDSLSVSDWSRVTSVMNGRSYLLINHDFSTEKEYRLYITHDCTSNYTCVVTYGLLNIALIGTLVPQGPMKRVDVSCRQEEKCDITIPTVNMKLPIFPAADVVIAKSCKIGKTERPYMTPRGIVSEVLPVSESATTLRWVHSEDGYTFTSGDTLRLCWCSVSLGTKIKCADTDFGIDVGKVYVLPNSLSVVTCYLGVACASFVERVDDESLEYFLSPTCAMDKAIQFTDGSTYFQKSMVPFGDVNMVKIKALLPDTDAISGEYKLCGQHPTAGVGESLNTRSVGLTFHVKRIELDTPRYYMSMFSTLELKLKDNLNIYQFFTLESSCGGNGSISKIYRYDTKGIELRSKAFSALMKVCWCTPMDESPCTTSEEFTTTIGEVFTSGFIKPRDLACDVSSNCELALEFEGFYNLLESGEASIPTKIDIKIQKDTCDVNSTQADVLSLVGGSKETVVRQVGGVFIFRKKLIFTGQVNIGTPGTYNLCYIREKESENVKLSAITLSGLMDSPPNLAVFLGRKFTVAVRGYHLNVTEGFFTLDSTCQLKQDDERFYIYMRSMPHHFVDSLGLTEFLWTDVLITRSEVGRYMASNDIKLVKASYYFCIITPSGQHPTNMNYVLHGPTMVTRLASEGPRGFKDLPLLHYPTRLNHLLVVNLLDTPHPDESCENNDWATQHSRITFSRYTFEPKYRDANFPTLLYSPNSFVCWCLGAYCNSIEDFRVSVLAPADNATKLSSFGLIPIDLKPLQINVSGAYTSYLDRLRPVVPTNRCGVAGSGLAPSLGSEGGIFLDPKMMSRYGTLYDIKTLYRNAMERPSAVKGKDIFRWESYALPLEVERKELFQYRLCYCPFLASGRCKYDEDYTEWVGAVVDRGVPSTEEYDMLFRISTFPSDVEDAPPCDPRAAAKSTLTTFNRMTKILNDPAKLLYAFIAAHRPSYDGFFIEVCRRMSNKETQETRPFQRVFAAMRSGHFRMGNIFLQPGVMQDVTVYGSGLAKGLLVELAIIHPFERCDMFAPSEALLMSASTTQVNENCVIFHNVVINHSGTYKYCLRFAPDKLPAQPANVSFFETNGEQAVDNEVVSREHTRVPTTGKAGRQIYLPGTSESQTATGSLQTGAVQEEHGERAISFVQTKNMPQWDIGGIVYSRSFRIVCLPDLMVIPFDKPANMPFNLLPFTPEGTCKPEWYRNYSFLCTLVEAQFFIVSDCENNLWGVRIPQTGEPLNKSDPPQYIFFPSLMNEPERQWKTCKEFPSKRAALLLGSKYLMEMKIPLDFNNKTRKNRFFKHGLINPMDITYFDDVVLISDEYTRTVKAFYNLSTINSVKDAVVLLRDCYHNALHVIDRKDSHLVEDLFALDAMHGSLTRYKIIRTPFALAVTATFPGRSSGRIDFAPLKKPCCMDGYFHSTVSETFEMLFVAENITGRIIVLKVMPNEIIVYKVISSLGTLKKLNIYAREWFVMLSRRMHQGNMSNCMMIRPIESYLNLSFRYNLMSSYPIGSDLDLIPMLKGDQFESFAQTIVPGKSAFVSLKSVGLKLDEATGVITGALTVSGCNTFSVMGMNLLKITEHSFTLCARCPPSHHFDKDLNRCEQCPIGTYRNNEDLDVCLPCAEIRQHSTTAIVGARVAADCLCDKGYYLRDNACVPCEPGTLKDEVSNAACTGTCGPDRTSVITKVNGQTVYTCHCKPKYFHMDVVLKYWTAVDKHIRTLVGIEFTDGESEPSNLERLMSSSDICVPCPIGYICEGLEKLPVPCGVGRTTTEMRSDDRSMCVCDTGYGYTESGDCVVCSGFGYKDVVGNFPCKPCTTGKNNAKHLPALPPLGPIRIITEAEWKHQLRAYRAKNHNHYPILQNMLGSYKLFSNSESSKRQEWCQYCVAGTHFDVNLKTCVKCPADRFCPGGDYQPSSCGTNGITRFRGSKSAMDCFCARGYGNLFEGRHPITGTIWCRHCVAGFFQHMESVDYACLPCPMHSASTDIGAKTILHCAPEPGYYLALRKLEKRTGRVINLWDSGSDNFEKRLAAERANVRIECAETPRASIGSMHSEKVLRDSMRSCQESCTQNIYCHGFMFEETMYYTEDNVNPYIANETTVFNGLRFLKRSHGTCTLHFFELSFRKITDSDTQQGTYADFVTVCRVYDPVFEYKFTTELCPVGHYCNGGIGFNRCPANSTTMIRGASGVAHCLCLPGYEASTTQTGVCVACPIGSYKQEIGNISCRRCPDRFRTFKTGSKYITDCACSPGHYAKVVPYDDVTHEATYKRMKDGSILPSSDDEFLSYYQHLLRIEHQRRASTLTEGNPYRIDLPMDTTDPLSQIESFMFLSKASLLLPNNAPSSLFAEGNYRTVSCERCKPYHYCPGGWVPTSADNLIHNIPYRCPYGANVPTEATNAASITQCLCLPGYRVNTETSDNPDGASSGLVLGVKSDATPGDPEGFTPNYHTKPGYLLVDGESSVSTALSQLAKDPSKAEPEYPDAVASAIGGDAIPSLQIAKCVKCEAGMYKEGQENSSCSGRCMQYATTYGGATSQKQCFCNYGRFMMLEDTLGSMQLSCAPCLKGAVCPGGLSTAVVNKLKTDGAFTSIRLQDHRRPMARFGFYAAFKDQEVELWSPVSHSKTSMQRISTHLLDFHACPLEYMCASMEGVPCDAGSSGYLCLNCERGYDRTYFRSKCLPCTSAREALVLYVRGRWLLWAVASLMLILLRKKMYYQFAIVKIWLEFCFSMVPYGMIPLNSTSSLRRFAALYNDVFGYQQQVFSYVGVRCLLALYTDARLSNAQAWYVQRFLVVLQPLADAAVLYAIMMVFATIRPLLRLKRHMLRRCESASSNSSSAVSLVNYDTDGLDAQDAAPGEVALPTRKERHRRKWPYVTPWRCLVAIHYLSFQFICQELLQTLWCVPIQYMLEPPIHVLLYLPTHVCAASDPTFLYPAVAALAVLLTMVLGYTGVVYWWVRRGGSLRMFSVGRQKHTLSWDSVMFTRRLFVAMIVVFQPTTLSTGSSEKLRTIGSILVTSLLLIAHMSTLPYQVRDDNLFNRLELFSLILNGLTGFMILGGFSYDLHNFGVVPMAASALYTCLLLWYVLVECGFISDLRPHLRRRMGLLPNFWAICRKLLLWHCHSHITFDYSKGDLVIERPFAGHAYAPARSIFGRRRTRVTLVGRRAFCLCIEQSISRYVMEQRCFCIPLYWAEFLVRYSFAYKCMNSRVRGRNVVSEDVRVRDMFSPELFNAGPINPWQLSIATLNVPLPTLVACYKEFERRKLGKLSEVKYRYSELCYEATQALSARSSRVPEMIEEVHLLDRLRRYADHLEKLLEEQVRNAREGYRVTREVQDLGADARVTAIANLGATKDGYDCIDLSNNEILKLENFPLLPRLRTLVVAGNRISKIAADLSDSLPNLSSVVLTANSVTHLRDLEPLFKLPKLERLSLLDNPVTAVPNFRPYVILRLPRLRYLNFAKVTQKERESVEAFFRTEEGSALLREQGYEPADAATGSNNGELLEMMEKTTDMGSLLKIEKRLLESESAQPAAV
ncbi:cysteine repeat modular protein, putative [Babesia caballi]|uniref:Cysteine repeat modular protein, putative n=1 Tax=Babesia caballi TaxID=5871 RepID=A0AAV4LVM7_BABCB|nr:cysteine repeat modular protein, putative [Babesia caballi]